ncbi:MAG TPA: hypothetical protein VIA06_18810 [Candidatus Dormibacteraeota bacterium]|jgi:hypothetical protein|nr:hypothetical protein [Candidatus Dormibacteraeota bacterium]
MGYNLIALHGQRGEEVARRLGAGLDTTALDFWQALGDGASAPALGDSGQGWVLVADPTADIPAANQLLASLSQNGWAYFLHVEEGSPESALLAWANGRPIWRVARGAGDPNLTVEGTPPPQLQEIQQLPHHQNQAGPDHLAHIPAEVFTEVTGVRQDAQGWWSTSQYHALQRGGAPAAAQFPPPPQQSPVPSAQPGGFPPPPQGQPGGFAPTPAQAPSGGAGGRYFLTLRRHTGMVVYWQTRRTRFEGGYETLMREYQAAQRHNLMFGWWSISSILFFNWLILFQNQRAKRQLDQLVAGPS